jgi:hypothetical protein
MSNGDTIIAVLLTLILGILYLLLKALSEAITVLNLLRELVQVMNSHVYQLIEPVNAVADSHLAEHPVGPESPKSRKLSSLIKAYSDHLMKEEQLSADEAPVRARFELYQFGESTLSREIDGFKVRTTERAADEAFLNSGILEKDIAKSLRENPPPPPDLFAPLYSLIVKEGYQHGEELELNIYGTLDTKNYAAFVKRMATFQRLLDIGALVMSKDEQTNDDDSSVRYKLAVMDLEQLRTLIYAGRQPHDNAYFEERCRDGELGPVLVRAEK